MSTDMLHVFSQSDDLHVIRNVMYKELNNAYNISKKAISKISKDEKEERVVFDAIERINLLDCPKLRFLGALIRHNQWEKAVILLDVL